MAVDPIIKQKAEDIRHKIYGKEVRESLASGLEAMSGDVVSVTGRQATVEEQFQSVLDETTGKDVISAPEIILARGGAQTLGERLDSDKAEVTAQLAQKVPLNIFNQLKSSMSSIPHGEIKLPDDFIKPEFNLWRDSNGDVQHDFDFEQFKTNAVELFVDPDNGNDSTGDGSRNNPYRTMSKCVSEARDGNEKQYKIVCLKSKFRRGYGGTLSTLTNKIVAIVPDEGIGEVVISNHEKMTWVDLGNGSYKTDSTSARSSTHSIMHLDYRDVYDFPIPFKYMDNEVDVQNTPYSWGFDSEGVLYANLQELQMLDAKMVTSVTQGMFMPKLINSTLYVENIAFLTGKSTQDNRISGDSTTKDTSRFIANNCKFVCQSERLRNADSNNSMEILDISKAYLFNCVAAYGGEDGFNYHYQGDNIGDSLVVEVDCLAYKNGHHSTTLTSNATTAHEAAHVLRIRSIGYDAKGPVLADVNGCKTICIDCHMRDALVGDVNNKSAYYFYNSSGFPTGYAYLINCSGGGEDTLSANANDGFDIYLQAFKGFNFREGFAPTIIS